MTDKPISEMLPQEMELELVRLRQENARLVSENAYLRDLVAKLRHQVEMFKSVAKIVAGGELYV